MTHERRREIAVLGGRAAHVKGVAHEFTSAEAASAASKGHKLGASHEFTRDEARAAGRKGGLARALNIARAAIMPPDAGDAALFEQDPLEGLGYADSNA